MYVCIYNESKREIKMCKIDNAIGKCAMKVVYLKNKFVYCNSILFAYRILEHSKYRVGVDLMYARGNVAVFLETCGRMQALHTLCSLSIQSSYYSTRYPFMPDRTWHQKYYEGCLHVTKMKTYANENQSQLLRRKYANKSRCISVCALRSKFKKF